MKTLTMQQYRERFKQQKVDNPIMGATNDNLVTIPDVELVSTGTYDLSSGRITFTTDMLAAAVGAQDDPAVHAPRLKIGHTSDFGDGEPCFGKVLNMRLTNEGHTIVGDYVGVPKWLAELMPTAYPSRSIEGNVDVTTSTGKHHDMVIEAMALLGVISPGVSVIDDLQELYGEEMPEGTITAGTQVMAKVGDGPDVQASVDTDDIRQQYYETLDSSQNWWWCRELYIAPTVMIVDDDEGQLYAVVYNIDGDTVNFSDPVEVKIQYVNVDDGKVAAASKVGAVSFASRSESRPETEDKEDQVELSKEQLQKLGLPEDASQEDVDAKLEEVTAETPAEETPETPAEETPEEETPEEETPEEEPAEEQEPAGVAGRGVTIDKDAFAQMQSDAAAGRKAHQSQLKTERDSFIEAALKKGKFPTVAASAYREQLAKGGEIEKSTRQFIDKLPENTVPVEEVGAEGNSEEFAASEAYPASWLPEIQATKQRVEAGELPPRVTQE